MKWRPPAGARSVVTRNAAPKSRLDTSARYAARGVAGYRSRMVPTPPLTSKSDASPMSEYGPPASVEPHPLRRSELKLSAAIRTAPDPHLVAATTTAQASRMASPQAASRGNELESTNGRLTGPSAAGGRTYTAPHIASSWWDRSAVRFQLQDPSSRAILGRPIWQGGGGAQLSAGLPACCRFHLEVVEAESYRHVRACALNVRANTRCPGPMQSARIVAH